MTGKADLSDQEWKAVLEGPPSAAMIVMMAQRGGTFRETIAMAKGYAEARQQHGESQLLDELASTKPEIDHTRYHSAGELTEHGLQHLRDAIEILERKATPEEVNDYRGFVRALCEKVANAHREDGCRRQSRRAGGPGRGLRGSRRVRPVVVSIRPPAESKGAMTSTTSYQTVRLSRGRHASPEDGACVMEMASMLAEEQFSDHPPSVCPVIGAFLRVYNDAVDDDRRQDLYGYAAKVVGSRASEDVTAARAAVLAERTRQLRTARRRWPLGLGLLIGFWWTPGLTPDASFAVSELAQRGRDGHRAALALVDELLAMRPDASYSALPEDVSASGASTPAESGSVAQRDRRTEASSPISSASSSM